MPYTQTQLDALRAALAEGVTEVSYDGRTVKYRSLAELKEIIGIVEAALAPSPPSRQHYPGFRRFAP